MTAAPRSWPRRGGARPPRGAPAAGALAALLALLAPGAARATGPLGPNGAPITTSDYAIDLTHGLVLGSTRVVGMAGAHVAIAEGAEGQLFNPAAAAARAPWSRAHTEFDLGLSVMAAPDLAGLDYFNTGERIDTIAGGGEFATVDLLLQNGTWGVGISVSSQTWRIEAEHATAGADSTDSVDAHFEVAHLMVARALFDGQLLLGLGSRVSNLQITTTDLGEDAPVVDAGAGAWEAGAVLGLEDQPFRLGLTYRSPVAARTSAPGSGDRVLFAGTPEALYLPRTARLPWELALGGALALGTRPLNPRWIDPARELEPLERRLDQRARERRRAVERGALTAAEAERAEADDERTLEIEEERIDTELRNRTRALPRDQWLLAASVLVYGPVADAVGVQSFAERRVNRSGERASVGYRLGAEGEVVPHWLKLRLGVYHEPTRFLPHTSATTGRAVDPSARGHLTGGVESRLFGWSVFGLFDRDAVWRMSLATDLAPRYFAWSWGLGFWH